MPTLILTPRHTPDAQTLWRAAGRLGWGVERLIGWRVTDAFRAVPEPVLYLEALMGPTLAAEFGLRLLEPDIDWLPRLPEAYRKRSVYLSTLGPSRSLSSPAFIKPPNDKSFPARVYTGPELPTEFDDDCPTLVAEVVAWEKEFRCFVLDRRPVTLSVYLRDGQVQTANEYAAEAGEEAEATAFIESVLADPRVALPRATVLDVGVIAGRGWAVVEQNSAWGSGIYGCDPERVLQVLRHSAVQAEL